MQWLDLLKGYVPFSEYCSPGFCVEEVFGEAESLKVCLILSPLNVMILQPSTVWGNKEKGCINLITKRCSGLAHSNAQRRSLPLRKLNDFSNISSVGCKQVTMCVCVIAMSSDEGIAVVKALSITHQICLVHQCIQHSSVQSRRLHACINKHIPAEMNSCKFCTTIVH